MTLQGLSGISSIYKRPSRATFLAKLRASNVIKLVSAYLIEKYEFR